MLPQQAKHQGKRPAPEEAYSRYIQRSISPSDYPWMSIPIAGRGPQPVLLSSSRAFRMSMTS